jgi:hypothetical protein
VSNVKQSGRTGSRKVTFSHIWTSGFLLFVVINVVTAVAAAGLPSGMPILSKSQISVAERTSTLLKKEIPTIPTTTPTLSQRHSSGQSFPRERMPRQPVIDEYTVALYRFDSNSGNTVLDATGRYTGTLYGNASITPSGLYSGALQLDGSTPGAYMRTGYLGPLSSGTIEAFVDFKVACLYAGEHFGIFSAGGEFGGYQQPVLWLGEDGYLKFKLYADNKLYMADSSINPCRYLDGNGSKDPYFSYLGIPAPWPYETWRFHHVAGTWGPRGIEIWVDGVLHGVGQYVPDPANPPSHEGYSCSPQQQATSRRYPDCEIPVPGLVPGSYGGGLPSYSTFLIGCDPSASCFNGRIDELRISNIQRNFSSAIVPPSTPTPTNTPVPLPGEYTLDANTLALYHLNSVNGPLLIDDAFPGRWTVRVGNAMLTTGLFGNALSLDGNESYFMAGDIGNPPNGTIEAWVILDMDSMSRPFGIVNVGHQMGSRSAKLLLGIPQNSTTFQFGINDSEQWHWADSGIPLPALSDACWHHVAGVWGNQGLEIWIDGVLRGTNTYTGKVPGSPDPYIFGCDTWGGCIRGKIDEVRLSSVRRSFSASALTLAVRRRALSSGIEGTRTFLPLVMASPVESPRCQFGR